MVPCGACVRENVNGVCIFVRNFDNELMFSSEISKTYPVFRTIRTFETTRSAVIIPELRHGAKFIPLGPRSAHGPPPRHGAYAIRIRNIIKNTVDTWENEVSKLIVKM